MRPLKYVLNGHDPVPSDDGHAVERAIGTVVACEPLGSVGVSTVFLAIDHGAWQAKPLLFETMVFGGPLAGACDRYSTWDEAVAGHAAMLARVRAAETKS